MAFTILVKNEGATATYTVEQQINPAERLVIFNDILSLGDERELQAYTTEDDGDSGGIFLWTRPGSSIYTKDVSAGGTLYVE